ncbi:MAG: hypothetical protein KIT60_14220 [Burkholderiaceae bacterium]|nr:hypothetical protein [Burkholderiaceae bacterium]
MARANTQGAPQLGEQDFRAVGVQPVAGALHHPHLGFEGEAVVPVSGKRMLWRESINAPNGRGLDVGLQWRPRALTPQAGAA